MERNKIENSFLNFNLLTTVICQRHLNNKYRFNQYSNLFEIYYEMVILHYVFSSYFFYNNTVGIERKIYIMYIYFYFCGWL